MCFAHALRYFPFFRFLLWQCNLQINLYKCGLSNQLYFPLLFPLNPHTITPFTKHSLYTMQLHHSVTLTHTIHYILNPNPSQRAENCINFCVISSVLRVINFCLLNILLFLHANYFHSTTSFNDAITISQYTPWQKTYGCVAVQIHTFLSWH